LLGAAVFLADGSGLLGKERDLGGGLLSGTLNTSSSVAVVWGVI
jgi:hypothetical protein